MKTINEVRGLEYYSSPLTSLCHGKVLLTNSMSGLRVGVVCFVLVSLDSAESWLLCSFASLVAEGSLGSSMLAPPDYVVSSR